MIVTRGLGRDTVNGSMVAQGYATSGGGVVVVIARAFVACVDRVFTSIKIGPINDC